MSHQVPDRNIHLLSGLGVFPRLESGDVPVHVVGKAHKAVLDQLHERQGGTHALADRCQVEHCTCGHLLHFRDKRLVAIGLQIHDPFSPDHRDHCSRDSFVGDRLFYHPVHL